MRSPRPGVVSVTVRDWGHGIKPADRERIFGRYYQAHSEAERTGRLKGDPGLGLGLYVSQKIIRLHGGLIRIESPPGGGTAFTVELPAYKGQLVGGATG